MNEFAKIFIVNNRMVLVRLDKNDDGENIIQFTTYFNGLGYLEMKIPIGENKDALEKTTEVQAKAYLERMDKQFGEYFKEQENE